MRPSDLDFQAGGSTLREPEAQLSLFAKSFSSSFSSWLSFVIFVPSWWSFDLSVANK
jgi:hypothetical protein